jgi:hypothetical protein
MKSKLKWILLGILAFCMVTAFIFGIIFFAMRMLKGDAYDLSLQLVRENPEVIEQIGGALEPSWYVLGSVSISGAEGNAAIEYTVSGELSKGSVYVYSTKHKDVWVIDALIVLPENTGAGIEIVGGE